MLVPIHTHSHWTLAVINRRAHLIEYYNSHQQSRHSNEVFDRLVDYLVHHAATPNTHKWTLQVHRDVPTQENDNDCGVFVCLYALLRARGTKLDFCQRSIAEARLRIVCELSKIQLLESV